MGKVGSWIDKKKLSLLKNALHKGESISEKYSWTIYVLLDLKVVYIITYAYITFVNLMSSYANSEATSDADSMMLFNITLSPELRDVEVDSISDSILWNCRSQSVTNYLYRFLYYMLIIVMGTALGYYFVVKCIALIGVSCFCKKFSCPCELNEYGLMKLWHIAVLEQLKVKAELSSQSHQQQPATDTEKTPKENNEQSQSDSDSQRNVGSRTQVVVVDIENNTDVANTIAKNDSSHSHQSISLVPEAKDNAHDEIQTPHDSRVDDSVQDETANMGQPDNSTTSKKPESSKFELKDYQSLLSENVTSDIFKGLTCRSRCTNYCRQAIPGTLLFLSVITLGLSFLSYDLHPLACIVQPAEDYISYNATTKRVELEFSDHLSYFQKSAGIVIVVLVITFLILAYCFYRLSEKVIEDIKAKAKIFVDEKTEQLEAKRLLDKKDTIRVQQLPTADR